jgi:hypothetical protein
MAVQMFIHMCNQTEGLREIFSGMSWLLKKLKDSCNADLHAVHAHIHRHKRNQALSQQLPNNLPNAPKTSNNDMSPQLLSLSLRRLQRL